MTRRQPVVASPLDEIAPGCPKCGVPLALEPVRGADDGRFQWICTNKGRCRYRSTRDFVVESLLRELRTTRDLLERFTKLALPGVVREMVADDTRCADCETVFRQKLEEALARGDERRRSEGSG